MKDNKIRMYEALKQKILTMDLQPDSPLDELEISAQYGLSRTPVRDTLRHLAGEGYVEIRANHGARVSPMGHEIRRNFLLVAPMIFTAIGRLAVKGFKPLQLIELKAAHERYRAACEAHQVQQMVLENHRFHEILGEMAASPYLEASLSRLLLDQARMDLLALRNRDPDAQVARCLKWQYALVVAIGDHDEAGVAEFIFRFWKPALSQESGGNEIDFLVGCR